VVLLWARCGGIRLMTVGRDLGQAVKVYDNEFGFVEVPVVSVFPPDLIVRDPYLLWCKDGRETVAGDGQ